MDGQGTGRMGAPWAPGPGPTSADPALAPVPWPTLWGLGAPSRKGLVPSSSAPQSGVGAAERGGVSTVSPTCPDGSHPQQETGLAVAASAWAPGFELRAPGPSAPRVWNRFIR